MLDLGGQAIIHALETIHGSHLFGFLEGGYSKIEIGKCKTLHDKVHLGFVLKSMVKGALHQVRGRVILANDLCSKGR